MLIDQTRSSRVMRRTAVDDTEHSIRYVHDLVEELAQKRYLEIHPLKGGNDRFIVSRSVIRKCPDRITEVCLGSGLEKDFVSTDERNPD